MLISDLLKKKKTEMSIVCYCQPLTESQQGWYILFLMLQDIYFKCCFSFQRSGHYGEVEIFTDGDLFVMDARFILYFYNPHYTGDKYLLASSILL